MKKCIVILFLSLAGFAKAQCPTYTNNILLRTGWDYMNNTTFNVDQSCFGPTCVTPNYGVYDPYWLITYDNSGGTPEPRPGQAVQNILTGLWIDYANTKWVTGLPYVDGGAGFLGNCCGVGFTTPGVGQFKYTFDHLFTLSCSSPTVTLTFSCVADNGAVISVNGSSITNVPTYNVGTILSVNIASLCSVGINTISIAVTDINGGGHGSDFSGAITTPSPCILTTTCMSHGIIQGKKWHDVNANSIMDVGESGIANYPILLTDGINTYTTLSGGTGDYFFTGLAAGNYTVSEMALPNYSIVSPAGGTVAVALAANQVTTGVNFFNILCYGITGISFNPSIPQGTVCSAATLAMATQTVENCVGGSYIYNWNFGDGITGSGASQSHNYQASGTYTLSCTMVNTVNMGATTFTRTIQVVDCPSVTCSSCIGSFAPDPGDYIVSLWVKEEYTTTTAAIAYTNTGVAVSFSPAIGQPPIVTTYSAFGSSRSPIIDGWQRIETKITVPSNAYQIHVRLLNNNNGGSAIDSYFDDIRIHPVDATMKSYVYDPVTLRLVAELDENNYSTRYEYDEEGKLVRVKKETEKGIMTIKETRAKNSKR